MKRFHVVVERRIGKYAKEVREPADVDDLMKAIWSMFRDLAAGGGCEGFTVTVHERTEACDHEL
jgi:hypothetical protein